MKHNKKDFWCVGNISNHIDSVFSHSNSHDPTLVASKSVTLIDHIYTSRPEEVMQVRVSTYWPGDHYPVSCLIQYGKSNKSESRVDKHR
jgi:endonuclease/exonuclease/phosphatase family metal-dependent hydrolase